MTTSGLPSRFPSSVAGLETRRLSSISLGKFLRTRHDKHPSNLLGPDAWEGWLFGLEASGFLYLVWLALEAKQAALMP